MKEGIIQSICKPLSGTIAVPGDKSISHRAIIFAALAEGKTTITNFLESEDCLRTIAAFQAMGVHIQRSGTTVFVESGGLEALQEPETPIYFGNSGTTARLMIGLLAGLPFFTVVHGDSSLSKRPMNRVVEPLRQMGANIDGRDKGNLLPLAIRGSKLKAIDYQLPVKSAQVKSALLLAGLISEGEMKITEKALTRDHTENMLQAFGADILTNQKQITIKAKQALQPVDVHVPGDISSAAFFLAAGAVVPHSSIVLEQVGINFSRSGILEVLEAMGANVIIDQVSEKAGEQFGRLTINHAALQGTIIEGDIIPRLIDEIPVIALLATQAKGETIIRDAAELRVKETDRIAAVADVLTTLGAHITTLEDGMIIQGSTTLHGGKVSSYHDHRIVMMAAVAGLIATEEVIIDDISSTAISYPNFFQDLASIQS